ATPAPITAASSFSGAAARFVVFSSTDISDISSPLAFLPIVSRSGPRSGPAHGPIDLNVPGLGLERNPGFFGTGYGKPVSIARPGGSDDVAAAQRRRWGGDGGRQCNDRDGRNGGAARRPSR